MRGIIAEFTLPCGFTVNREMDPSDLVGLLPCGIVFMQEAKVYARKRRDEVAAKLESGEIELGRIETGHDVLLETESEAYYDKMDEAYQYMMRELRNRYVDRAENIKTGKKLVGLDPLLAVLFLTEDDLLDAELSEIDTMDCPCDDMGQNCIGCAIRRAS